jgi:porin
MGAVFNGVPGRPGEAYGTHVTLGERDGVFSSLEAGVDTHGNRPTKLAIGAWIDTSRYTTQPYPQRNHDWYAIGQTRLAGGVPGRAVLDGFVQWGSAMTRDQRIDRYISAGLRLDGAWMRDRPASLGLAMARALVRGLPGGPPGGAETAWELTASTALGPHLSLQPDLQYIRNPGATGTLPDALVAGMRFQLRW